MGKEKSGDQVGEYQLDIVSGGSIAHVPGRDQVFFCLGVVFFQELDDANIVLEGDYVRSWEGFEGGHVCS